MMPMLEDMVVRIKSENNTVSAFIGNLTYLWVNPESEKGWHLGAVIGHSLMRISLERVRSGCGHGYVCIVATPAHP